MMLDNKISWEGLWSYKSKSFSFYVEKSFAAHGRLFLFFGDYKNRLNFWNYDFLTRVIDMLLFRIVGNVCKYVLSSSMCIMVYLLYIIYNHISLFCFGKYFWDLKGLSGGGKNNTDTMHQVNHCKFHYCAKSVLCAITIYFHKCHKCR